MNYSFIRFFQLIFIIVIFSSCSKESVFDETTPNSEAFGTKNTAATWRCNAVLEVLNPIPGSWGIDVYQDVCGVSLFSSFDDFYDQDDVNDDGEIDIPVLHDHHYLFFISANFPSTLIFRLTLPSGAVFDQSLTNGQQFIFQVGCPGNESQIDCSVDFD